MANKVTLDTFYQEFKDFSSYLTNKVDSIEAQTKKTNGRVNKHDTLLALIDQNYKTCPARQLSELPNKYTSINNKIALFALVIATVIAVFNIVLNFL